MTKIIPFDINKSGVIKYRNGKVPLEWCYLRHAVIEKPLISTKPDKTWTDHFPNGTIRWDNASSQWDLVMEIEVEEVVKYQVILVLKNGNIVATHLHNTLERAKDAVSYTAEYVKEVHRQKYTFIEGEKPKVEIIE